MELELSAPKGVRDNQYLKECEPSSEFSDAKAFCRKKSFKIDLTGEKRVIRSCGYIPEASIIAKENEGYCLQADNEGLDQKICSCYEDGCNSSPFTVGPLGLGTLSLTLAFSLFIRRFL
ncbi:hypothetical protein ACFFRR_007512 [Megaselia abdita]